MAALRISALPLALLLILSLCLGASAFAQTAHTLTVTVDPPEGGTVMPDCRLGCSHPSGSKVNLIALPKSGYAFDQWKGSCDGTNPSVTVTMTGPLTCQAKLSQCNDTSPALMGTTPYSTFDKAYHAASGDTTTILVRAVNLQETLRLDHPVSIVLKGGHTCGYETNLSCTLLQGQLIIKSGSATVENLIIFSGTAPVITSLVADPTASGATLSWTIADAVSAAITPVVGPVDPISGSVPVTLSETTTYTLTATDAYNRSVQAQVTVLPTNRPPVANAGQDRTVAVGATVGLDGSSSSDIDGDALTYQWAFVSKPEDSAATLSDPAAVKPTFIADKAGTYVAQLIVNDGKVNSGPDTVSITTQNSAPVANAGPDQTVFKNATVTLNGGGSSDLDGNPLTYKWSFISKPSGSLAALSDDTAVGPTFVADKTGTYVLELIVSDGLASSTPDTVGITAQGQPQPPGGVLLPGAPDSPAVHATYDLSINPGVPVDEIEDDPSWGRIARSELEIGFIGTATVGEVNGLLASTNGRIVNMIEGVAIVVVRFPDTGSVPALENLILNLESSPIVRFVRRGLFPSPDIYPDNIAPDSAHRSKIDHLIAVRASAAWNVRYALRRSGLYDPPLMFVYDAFGDGPPNADYAFDVVNPADFASGKPESHGYKVISTIGADFGGQVTDRGLATGIYPDTLPLRVLDNQLPDVKNLTWAVAEDILIKWIKEYGDNGSRMILNTSLGYGCDTLEKTIKVCNATFMEKEALRWIEKVRDAEVENAFLHTKSAGNTTSGVPATANAAVSSQWCAASLLELQDCFLGVCWTVDNITNMLVVENQINDATFPYQPICLSGDSSFHGHLSAIGTGVWILSDANSSVDVASGTSFAAPQVAGLAAYLWTLAPQLSVQDVKRIILASSRDAASWDPSKNAGCSIEKPAPIIDAYAAVLSLDQAVAPTPSTAPIRFTILDVNEDGKFDENDVQMFLNNFYDTDGHPKETDDCGRYDLNGDCYTGGSKRERFDLDRAGSAQYGESDYSTVAQNIEGASVSFYENSLTDMDILCYYAYSDLYTGSDTTRKELLRDRCAELTVELEFPSDIPNGGSGELRVHAGYIKPDGSTQWSAGIDITITVNGGSANPNTGTTDTIGYFVATVQHDGASNSISVTVTATDSGGRTVTKTAAASIGGPADLTVTYAASWSMAELWTCEPARPNICYFDRLCDETAFLYDRGNSLSLPITLASSCSPYGEATMTVQQVEPNHFTMEFSGSSTKAALPCDPPRDDCYRPLRSATGSSVHGQTVKAGTYTVELSVSSASLEEDTDVELKFSWGGSYYIDCYWANYVDDPADNAPYCQYVGPQGEIISPGGSFTVDVDLHDEEGWGVGNRMASSTPSSHTPVPATVRLSGRVFSIKPK